MKLSEHLTAASTARAYAADRRYFDAWAAAAGVDPGPPTATAVVKLFVEQHLEGLAAAVDAHLVEARVKRRLGPLAIATVERRVAALRAQHRRAGMECPVDQEVRDLLRAGRRARARSGGPRKPRAITLSVLERLLATCGDDLVGVRDAALLLVGFCSGGRRRSELAAAEVEQLSPDGGEWTWRLPRSKTDQLGRGFEVPIAGRAAEALHRWLAAATIESGPLFRRLGPKGEVLEGIRPADVNAVVKTRARAAGFRQIEFSAHSLRSGYMTEAGKQGINLGEAMALSGHSDPGVALGYHQAGAALTSPGARLAG